MARKRPGTGDLLVAAKLGWGVTVRFAFLVMVMSAPAALAAAGWWAYSLGWLG